MASSACRRCEPLIGDRYQATYDADPRFGTSKAIISKNIVDLKRCDVTLCYLPKPAEGAQRSAGTICEAAWSFALGLPLIVVSNDPFVKEHPVLSELANWNLDTLDQACETLIGIFGVYARSRS